MTVSGITEKKAPFHLDQILAPRYTRGSRTLRIQSLRPFVVMLRAVNEEPGFYERFRSESERAQEGRRPRFRWHGSCQGAIELRLERQTLLPLNQTHNEFWRTTVETAETPLSQAIVEQDARPVVQTDPEIIRL